MSCVSKWRHLQLKPLCKHVLDNDRRVVAHLGQGAKVVAVSCHIQPRDARLDGPVDKPVHLVQRSNNLCRQKRRVVILPEQEERKKERKKEKKRWGGKRQEKQ